jgi:hypothetical protein
LKEHDWKSCNAERHSDFPTHCLTQNSGGNLPATVSFTGANRLNLTAGTQYTILLAFNQPLAGGEPGTVSITGPGNVLFTGF